MYVVLGTRNDNNLKLQNIRVVPGCSKNIISMMQLTLEGWKITGGDNRQMTMSHGDKKIHFRILEKHLYYLEGKPGCHVTEVNAPLWDELTDEDMPILIDGAYSFSDSSSKDDSNFSASDMPEFFDKEDREEGNVFASIFMDSGNKTTLQLTGAGPMWYSTGGSRCICE